MSVREVTRTIFTAATVSPSATDDSFAVGARWVNTVTKAEFVCVSNAAGAAVWRRSSASPASKIYAAQNFR